MSVTPVAVTPRDGSEFHLLIAALDQEGSAQRSLDLPVGLADRIFDLSVVDLRRSVAASAERASGLALAEAGEGGTRLRLVGVAAPSSRRPDVERRGVAWRRLAPFAAMAACIGLAAIVTNPSVLVALRGPEQDGPPPIAFAVEDEGSVMPVLVALYQRETEGAWGGIPVPGVEPALLRAIGSEVQPASLRGAVPMIPIVEAHEADFSDLAEEFARIREAASTTSSRL